MHRLATAGALILGLAFSAGAGRAQTPTLASAHQFVTMKLGNGISEFSLNDDQGDPNGEMATITSLVSSTCTTRLDGRAENGKYMSRVIPWSKISSVSRVAGLRQGVTLSGSVHMTDGQLTGQLDIIVDSNDTQERLLNAMQFIRQACDVSRSTGF